jgi:ATP-dependent DNA helicase RecQ
MNYTACLNVEMNLLPALRRYWGYDSFRPLQERIVRSLLQKRDTCVVMPTGGGKSLCYQLPAALLSEQTVIVVSPLIALMQDQVAQLTQMGITAALLNSSVPAAQQAEIMREANRGQYRLLYLSPERLARADTVEWLRHMPVSFFVIDEAHCISEWGHEFRPEYRQMSSLRANFPDRPIAAFTASATQRVRHDIIDQLQLRDPHKYIASFHRPNLRYIIKECTGREQPNLLIKALRAYPKQNVIVYAPTINKVEETVDLLEEHGISAIAYHGKMDNDERRENQERWMSDEVRVLVGTVAFGLGINKSGVRAVIHLSLPKSIEQFYQEAGRAGRDGLPADCVVLWQKRDVGLLTYFVEQLTDPEEKTRAWKRYHIIRDFVESKLCRHRQICSHFGENPKFEKCDACDACGSALDWLAEAVVAKPSVPYSPAISSTITTPSERSGSFAESALSSVDPELREYLREWRRLIAKEQGVPAYVVMHDTSLDALCRKRPRTMSQLLAVPGFGQRKSEMYGQKIFDVLNRFRNGARASAESGIKNRSRRRKKFRKTASNFR